MEGLYVYIIYRLFQETLFLQGAKSGGADVEFDLLTVNDEGLFLDVGFEDLASLSLGERNIVAVHLAFAGDFANCH